MVIDGGVASKFPISLSEHSKPQLSHLEGNPKGRFGVWEIERQIPSQLIDESLSAR
jgi:hypothetical protein